jgi:hypothetical protein
MALPRQKQAELMASINGLGGLALWSVRAQGNNEFFADCGVLLEQLLPRIVELLNLIMRLTPVETMQGVHLSAADLKAPDDNQGLVTDMFSKAQSRCVRALLGL